MAYVPRNIDTNFLLWLKRYHSVEIVGAVFDALGKAKKFLGLIIGRLEAVCGLRFLGCTLGVLVGALPHACHSTVCWTGIHTSSVALI